MWKEFEIKIKMDKHSLECKLRTKKRREKRVFATLFCVPFFQICSPIRCLFYISSIMFCSVSLMRRTFALVYDGHICTVIIPITFNSIPFQKYIKYLHSVMITSNYEFHSEPRRAVRVSSLLRLIFPINIQQTLISHCHSFRCAFYFVMICVFFTLAL